MTLTSSTTRFVLKSCLILMLIGGPGLAQDSVGAASDVAQLTTEYESAVERGDLQKALRTQEEALKLWNTLEPSEKRRLEIENPGMFRWLQGGAAYDTDGIGRRGAARAHRRR